MDLYQPGGRRRVQALARPAIITSHSGRQNWRTQAIERVLWDLANHAASDAVQVYAAATLLERWHGKPEPMVIEMPVDQLSLMTDEEIKAELARLRAVRWD